MIRWMIACRGIDEDEDVFVEGGTVQGRETWTSHDTRSNTKDRCERGPLTYQEGVE